MAMLDCDRFARRGQAQRFKGSQLDLLEQHVAQLAGIAVLS